MDEVKALQTFARLYGTNVKLRRVTKSHHETGRIKAVGQWVDSLPAPLEPDYRSDGYHIDQEGGISWLENDFKTFTKVYEPAN